MIFISIFAIRTENKPICLHMRERPSLSVLLQSLDHLIKNAQEQASADPKGAKEIIERTSESQGEGSSVQSQTRKARNLILFTRLASAASPLKALVSAAASSGRGFTQKRPRRTHEHKNSQEVKQLCTEPSTEP
eukprot:scaffold103739_cov30-Tisochrysis_lutea.AAC.1